MNRHHLIGIALAGAAALAGACTSSHGGRPPQRTTTTVPVTIPIDGWAIAGVTTLQVCGGAYRPDQPTCRPAQPASEDVIVSRDGTTVARTTSAADGTFRIPVGPGTYAVQASHPGSVCPTQNVVVNGPPVPTRVTLTCELLAP